MKYRLFILLCLIPALILSSGCAPAPAPTLPPTELPAPEESSGPAPTEPAPPEPIRSVESVVYDAPYSIHFLDSYTAAVMWYEYPENDFHDSVTHLDVVDLYSGTVTATAVMEDSDYCYPQSPGNGILIVANYENSLFRVLDARLNVINTIPVPSVSGCFNADLSKFYYEADGILFALDTATGDSAAVSAAADYRFSSLDACDPETGALLGRIRTSRYSYDSCSVLIDPDTGNIHMLSEIPGLAQPTASGVCFSLFDEETYTPYMMYTAPESGTFLEIPAHCFDSGLDSYLSPVLNSDYFVATSYSDNTVSACTIYRIGETITAYSLDLNRFPEGLMSMAQAPDGRLVGMERRENGYGLCVLSPDALPFEEVCLPTVTNLPLVDTSIPERLAAEQNHPLTDELAQVQATADRLEETYGVTILLSDQCQTPASYCPLPITTTDRNEWMDEAACIADSLTYLETVLSMYPDGFFRQFRNDAGEYGLLVMLIDHFESENNTIGYQFNLGDWYCVAVDISYSSPVETYCHEIWHATETKIENVDYMLLDEETWNSLNPEGFVYSYSDTMDYLSDTEWTYLSGGCGNDSYFVDSYARVNSREDRARLMEYIMADDDIAAGLMDAPALRRKLEIMSEALRCAFDTTAWENVRWERFFPEGEQSNSAPAGG